MNYLADQLNGAGIITYRKMFGEYVVYCNSKVIGLVCDGQFYLKKTESGRKLLCEVIEASAYKGAKPSFLIESIDDKDYMAELIRATYFELPEPSAKKTKTTRN